MAESSQFGSSNAILGGLYNVAEIAETLQDDSDPFAQINSCLGALTVVVANIKQIARAIEPADAPLRPQVLRLDGLRRRLAIWVYETEPDLSTLAKVPSFKSSTQCELVTDTGESLRLNIDMISAALSRIIDCSK